MVSDIWQAELSRDSDVKFNANVSYKEVGGAGAGADIEADQGNRLHFHSSCGDGVPCQTDWLTTNPYYEGFTKQKDFPHCKQLWYDLQLSSRSLDFSSQNWFSKQNNIN